MENSKDPKMKMFAYVFTAVWGNRMQSVFPLFLTIVLEQQSHCLSRIQCEEEYPSVWNMKHVQQLQRNERIKDGRENQST